jgi:enamine deaminase RidA (YjgF/YER057c/UK114 family)
VRTVHGIKRRLFVAVEEHTVIVEDKLKALGLTLPDLDELYRRNASGARFISHYAVQNILHLSGTTPMKDGQPFNPGVLGQDLTLQQGYEAARYATLASLTAVKYALGDLDRVQQIVQVIGFVNSAPGFSDQPRVINGATDLLVELYGERGKPTRAAIGCQGLALNHSVEIVMTVLFAGSDVRAPLARDHYAR